jgi:hypothetical protein
VNLEVNIAQENRLSQWQNSFLRVKYVFYCDFNDKEFRIDIRYFHRLWSFLEQFSYLSPSRDRN